MKNLVVIAALALVTGPALAQRPQETPGQAQPGQAQPGQAQQPKQLSADDRKFVMKTAQENMAEIEMGKLAMEKAQNEQVKDYARKVVEDHEKAQAELRQIAGDENLPMPTEPGMMRREELHRLQKLSGEKFDREYMKIMSKAHDKDIREFERAQNKVQDPQLKSFVQTTLPTLKEHKQNAQQMKGELKGESK